MSESSTSSKNVSLEQIIVVLSDILQVMYF